MAFGDTDTTSVPLPCPLLGVTVSHGDSLSADQLHSLAAETVTLSDPPELDTLWAAGDTTA